MSDVDQELDQMVRKEFGPGILFKYAKLPSGVLDLELRWGGHFAVIQGKGDEWGLSVDIPDGAEFMPHDHFFESFHDALQAAKPLMLNPEPRRDTGSTGGFIKNRLTETTDN